MIALHPDFLRLPLAHRGLHGPGVPENSMAAFRAAIARGYGIECDIQRALDDTPMVFHDNDLARLTGEARGTVAASTPAQLARLRLMGSGEGIPTLADMLAEVAGGVPLLIEAGVHLPGLHAGDPARVALEAYPGLLARELIGALSYKNDAVAKQTPERLIARKDLVHALEQGRTRLGLRLRASHAQRDALVADASGDRLDAVLCLLQAGWAATQPGHGLPAQVDPLEGWIVSA